MFIDRAELLGLLATTGQQPRDTVGTPGAHPSMTTPGAGGGHPVAAVDTPPGSAEVATLRAQLEAARREADLRAELATVRGELLEARAQLEARDRDADTMRAALVDTRAERDAWRERYDARDAELRAVRAMEAAPWWRRWFGSDPSIPSIAGPVESHNGPPDRVG